MTTETTTRTETLRTDEREALRIIARHHRSLATLAETLGLSGTTAQTRALCDAIDGLESRGYIARLTDDGWTTERWQITDAGVAALDTPGGQE